MYLLDFVQNEIVYFTSSLVNSRVACIEIWNKTGHMLTTKCPGDVQFWIEQGNTQGIYDKWKKHIFT